VTGWMVGGIGLLVPARLAHHAADVQALFWYQCT